MSPPRSELNATELPSGDQAPRLSSRVVLMRGSGSPVGKPFAGDTGNRQMSAFWRSVVKAMSLPSREIAGSTSWPAPVVTCCSGPSSAPSAVMAARQRFVLPLRSELK